MQAAERRGTWKREGLAGDTFIDLEPIVGESTKNLLEPRIIGIVTPRNLRDPKTLEALADCDLAEFRADGLEPADIPAQLLAFNEAYADAHGYTPEIIFTLRLRRDGGAWDDARADERERVWLALIEAEATPAFLDIETDAVPRLSKRLRDAISEAGIRMLVSHHDFNACPPVGELRRLLSAAAERGAGFKAAVTCKSRGEILELLAFAREAARAVPIASVFSMGMIGRATRLLTPLLGCALTYGYLGGGAVAPGQLSARSMRGFYRALPKRAWAGLSDGELLDATTEAVAQAAGIDDGESGR